MFSGDCGRTTPEIVRECVYLAHNISTYGRDPRPDVEALHRLQQCVVDAIGIRQQERKVRAECEEAHSALTRQLAACRRGRIAELEETLRRLGEEPLAPASSGAYWRERELEDQLAALRRR